MTIASPTRPALLNGSPEQLIKSVELDGRESPVHWKFDEGASRIETHRVVFVYESESPHLRLTWEWEARAGFGPIGHQIHIQNLSDRKLWLSLRAVLGNPLKGITAATNYQLHFHDHSSRDRGISGGELQVVSR